MLASTIPLPRDTIALVERSVPISTRHPGLQLDKFVRPAKNQQEQKLSLDEVCQTRGDNRLLRSLQQRRSKYLQALSASTWRCTTAGPFTLHLARASALENAGICLHPIYGFVYLPGTGLKGMARAYAETVWFPSQYAAAANGEPADDQQQRRAAAAWQKIQSTFGWAPHSDDGKSWRPRGIRRHEGNESAAGSIVFHDAWPEQWPRLQQDIVNNHHTEYYQNEQAAPGDWELPDLVSFLALGAGETFCFALSKRRADVDDELLGLARRWLTAALVYEGAGAKTAAGYGSFRVAEGEAPRLDSPARATWEGTLELVTPAFLAGAHQDADDCDLRPATLRGLLRWWWRTMHAGFLDAATLHRLETAVWGDVNTGGAVRVSVERAAEIVPLQYDKHFLRQKNNLPVPREDKTTQGLWYHSFGMDDYRKDDAGQSHRHQRWFVAPGSSWNVRLTARASSLDRRDSRGKIVDRVPLPDPEVLLTQAKSALWLLCHFGGVGSKSRKGFGSLAVPSELASWTLDRCQREAKRLRDRCLLKPGRFTGSPALEQALAIPDVSTQWTNYWYTLDRLAAVAQRFAQAHKHQAEKKALGLPRNVGRPLRGSFRAGSHADKSGRHASPVLYHVAGGSEGLTIRVVAFPTPELPADPTLEKSRRFLRRLLDHLQSDLSGCAQADAASGQYPVVNPARAKPASTEAAGQGASTRTPPSGAVRVTVLGRHEKLKDAYFVQEEGKPRGILQHGTQAKSPEPGDVIEVYRSNTDPRSPQYRWDSPSPPARRDDRRKPPRRK